MNWPWEALGLPGPSELAAIRRAYAEQLKRTRPEEDPEGFQRLHDAYQAARRLAGRNKGGADCAQASDDETETGQSGESADRAQASDDGAETVRPGTWDFERLFAEGEAEERGRRFQKLLELRRENQSRYDAWRPAPNYSPAEAAVVWMAVFHAASLMEELARGGADVALWGLFCKSELFSHVKDCPDFVFALESFLKERPELPEAVRRTLFRAYGFDVPPVRREYRPLYELLEERLPTRRQNRARLPLRGLLALIAVVLALNLCADFLASEHARAVRVRDWLSQDFGREFVLAEIWLRGSCATFLDPETGLYFRAAWEGSRDMDAGRRGYATNYAEARISQEIAAFAERRNVTVSPRYESGNPKAGRGDWSASYAQIPLTGAGEEITALGNLLSALRTQDWRQAASPDFRLYLGWQNWSFCEYDAQTAEFDAPALREYYERWFGADLCRIAVRSTGVGRADMGKSFLLMPDSGSVQIESRAFFHVTGLGNPAVRPLYHYLLSGDGAELFCVPGQRKLAELTLEELRRMDKREYEVKGFSQPLTVFHTEESAKE